MLTSPTPRLLFASLGALLHALSASADPLVAQVARCDVTLEEDVGTGAVGNTAARRGARVLFGYADSGNGTLTSQVNDTSRVEVCSARGTGAARTLSCPWSESSDTAWVVYDDGASEGVAPDTGKVQALDETVSLESSPVLPIDWADPANDGTFLLVRVNGSGTMNETELAAIAADGGFCPVPYLLAGGWDQRFRIHGVPRTVANPFASTGFDPCLDGNRALPGLVNGDSCIDQLVAEYTFGRYKQMDDWQVSALLDDTPLNPETWRYGSGGNCGSAGCPLQVFLIAMPGYSLSSLGTNRLAVSGATMSGSADFFGGNAAWILGNLAHEYVHTFQYGWRRAAGTGANQSGNEPFEESGDNALQSNHCLFGYPERPSNLCVNLTRINGGLPDGTMNEILDNPAFPLLGIPYRAAIFWRYAIEQYATPLAGGNPAHPAGTASGIPSDASKPLGHIDRRADEGSDLMRRVLERFDLDKNLPILDAIDLTLQQHLGRALEPLIHDLHTAMVLKDYKDTEARWRFEWVGNANADGTNFFPSNPPSPSLATLRPFPVPADLRQAGPDLLNRAKRVLDSYDPGIGAPIQKTMLAGDFLASASPQGLSAFGAAFLSVHPAPGFNLRVRLLPELGTKPRFRIFTVDAAGVPTLLSNCDQNPSNDPLETGTCQLSALAVDDGQGGFTERYLVDEIVPIPLDGSVDEVIVIASAGRQPAAFSWTFGDVQPTLLIIDPTTSTPAQIGHVLPGADKRPFLLQFALLDQNGLPMGADATQVRISVPGCAAASCVLDPASDYELTGFAGGVHWAVVTLPDAFYPAAGDGFLDLRVEMLNLPTALSTATAALHYHDTPYSIAMYMVLDKSGSMASLGGSKLLAMRIAGKAVFESLADADAAGIVTFNEDAQLRFGILPLSVGGARDAMMAAIDQITPAGCTSIGDGVLEAQQFLAQTFDNLSNPLFPTLPDRQSLVVLSDGKGNSDWPLYQYYTHQPFPVTFLTDGTSNFAGCTPDPDPSDNTPWFVAPLRYPDRLSAGLPLPVISTVALGADADLGEMQSLASIGGGVFTFISGPADSTLTQAMSGTIELSDSFRQAHDDAAGFERVQAVTTLAALAELMPDLPVDTNVSELLVTVTSARDQTDGLRLVDPTGTVVAPTVARFEATTFRIPDPIPGTWTWQLLPSETGAPPPSPSGNDAAVFVEQAVRSTLGLFAGADVVAPFPHTGLGGQFESGRYVGSDVFVRGVPIEGVPITGASVSAEVIAPDTSMSTLLLEDDGLHNDGSANDGIYGALYTNTSQSGAYQVRVRAVGTSPATGGPFTRERLLGFALHDAPDSDGDGLPDPWERRHGTDLGVPDATADPDGDGLENETELVVGTLPLESDSDAGGEADGSELNGGRDPLDPSDDQALVFEADVVPGNGKVLVRPRLDPAQVDLVEIQWAPDPAGPFLQVFSGALPAEGVVSDPASNDAPACYRIRTSVAGAQSAWSPPVCVQPAMDPFPPALAPRVSSSVDASAVSALVTLGAAQLGFRPRGAFDPLLDPEVSTTALEAVRYSQRRDFNGASWLPFTSEVNVPLVPNQTTYLYFQIRDAAGNLSTPQLLAIPRSVSAVPSFRFDDPKPVAALALLLAMTGTLLLRRR